MVTLGNFLAGRFDCGRSVGAAAFPQWFQHAKNAHASGEIDRKKVPQKKGRKHIVFVRAAYPSLQNSLSKV
jgi:hypothetical protein